MDSIILALAIKLYKKLLSFMKDYQSDVFGTSSRNVYVGPNDDDMPNGYELWQTVGGTYTMGANVVPQFDNLTIGVNSALTSTTPYLFLYVRDTLRIKVGGKLHLDAKGDNTYTYSPFLPKPNNSRKSTQLYTTACLKMYLSGRDIRTNLDLSVMGGNAGGQANLSLGGTSGGGGGLVCIYHQTGKLVSYNTESGVTGSISNDFVTANGGQSGAQGGGMLFVFARNVIIETNGQQHGTISANGGDGLGIHSYINENPNPNDSIASHGGGGVVHHVELDVI